MRRETRKRFLKAELENIQFNLRMKKHGDMWMTQNPIENFQRVSLKVELKRVRFDDGHMVQGGLLQQARWLGGPSAKRGGCHEAHLGKPGLSM